MTDAPPSAYPAPVRPPKRRPSTWWFAPGAALLVAGIVLAVVVATVLVGMFHTDGYVPPDGHGHRVAVGAGEHTVFSSEIAAGECAIKGASDVRLADGSTSTLTINDTQWYPNRSFTTSGARTVTIACNGRTGIEFRVGEPVSAGRILGAILGGFAAAALGFVGLVGLAVVAIVYFTRPPRSVTG